MNIRKDLIAQELNNHSNLIFKKFKPTNKNINKLFNHYYTEEFTEHFYDDEPDFSEDFTEEEYYMYLDIKYPEDNCCYSKKKHTKKEKMIAYNKVKQIHEDYNKSEHRFTFCTWIEAHGEGIWGVNQKTVDRCAKNVMKSIKRREYSYNDRIYYAKDDVNNLIYIYYYGRDYGELVDYWWVMHKNKK